MKKFTKNLTTALTITTVSLTSTLLIVKPAQANWLKEKIKNTPLDHKTWNPGTWHKDLKNTPLDTNTWTKTANDAAQQAEKGLRQLGGHLVKGLKTGVKLCQEVGVTLCWG